MAIQVSHRAVRELGYLPPGGGVFISRWHHGSPAHRYGLFGLHWLTELDGRPTPGACSFNSTPQDSGGPSLQCFSLSSPFLIPSFAQR